MNQVIREAARAKREGRAGVLTSPEALRSLSNVQHPSTTDAAGFVDDKALLFETRDSATCGTRKWNMAA